MAWLWPADAVEWTCPSCRGGMAGSVGRTAAVGAVWLQTRSLPGSTAFEQQQSSKAAVKKLACLRDEALGVPVVLLGVLYPQPLALRRNCMAKTIWGRRTGVMQRQCRAAHG